MSQMKEDKNKTEVSNMLDEEFKVMVIYSPDFREEWMNSELQQRERKYKRKKDTLA